MHAQHVGLEVGRFTELAATEAAPAQAAVDLAVVAERAALAVGAATELTREPPACRTHADTEQARQRPHWRPHRQAQLRIADCHLPGPVWPGI